MSDIFLSYNSNDFDRVKPLAAALESQGWTVFYDRTIPAGTTWRQYIGNEIEKCRCMVVVWSTNSVNSNWVEVEADIGLQRKILVPLLLDQVTPPLGFGSIQAANLVGWQGETDSSGYLALCKALPERIGHKASHQPTNEPKITESHWSKQLSVKVGKITVIAVTLSILLWYVVPVFYEYITDQLPSVSPYVTDGKLIKEPKMLKTPVSPEEATIPSQTTIVDSKVANQPLFKEPEMREIPSGEFQMGSNDGDPDEKPVHHVKLKSFAIGRYEVTFDEYDQFADAIGKPKPDDNNWGRGKRPVINVNWEEAVAYAQWLSSKTGKKYHLPTEAQWEYAARAHTTGDFYWEDLGEAKDFAWFLGNSLGKTHPVGEIEKENGFKLKDTAGNVWEWVQDCYQKNYDPTHTPTDGSAWEPQYCSKRVLRGGSWRIEARSLRSANRFSHPPDHHDSLIGFRLAKD